MKKMPCGAFDKNNKFISRLADILSAGMSDEQSQQLKNHIKIVHQENIERAKKWMRK